MNDKPTMTVCVENWICRAYHGVFKEEQRTGNEFVVSIRATYEVISIADSLSDTISYTDLLEIARVEMGRPMALLETVAMRISSEIKKTFPQVISVKVSLQKAEPPISNFQGSVGVIFEQNFIRT